ncbi:MAG: DNA repair exonuclease [Coriobacteriia bacterium]|nr:DNA repair exonuclease [Coriobacteriia bacterium]
MPRPIKFLHVADTHLGAGFSSVTSTSTELGKKLRDATLSAFDKTIDYACEHEVDFVCFAGDLYDADSGNFQAQSHVVEGIKRLDDVGIRAFLAAGNHDPLGDTARLTLPKNAHTFPSERVEAVDIDIEGAQSCTVYGRSYQTAEETSNFAKGYHRGPEQNAVGILHTNVAPDSTSDHYARCSLHDLVEAGMDYWALGHIHLEQILNKQNPAVVYPGSPQALNIKEVGRHGCYLVTLDKGHATYSWLPTGVIDFVHVEIDIGKCQNMAEVIQAIEPTVLKTFNERGEAKAVRPSIVRLVLTGTRQFNELLDHDALLSSSTQALNGSLPDITLDDKLIDRTKGDVHKYFSATSNQFIADIVGTEASIFFAEPFITKHLKGKKIDLSTLMPELVEEFDSPEAHERLFLEAQELLYRHLMGENE